MPKYIYAIEDTSQFNHIKFCPYCGSDTMHIYNGDWHSYTSCLKCEYELEVRAIMEDDLNG